MTLRKPKRSQRSQDTQDKYLLQLFFLRQWDSCGAQIPSSIIGNFRSSWRCHHSSPASTGPQEAGRMCALAAQLHPKPFSSLLRITSQQLCQQLLCKGHEGPNIWQVLPSCQVSPPLPATQSQSQSKGNCDVHGHFCCLQTVANAASTVIFLTETHEGDAMQRKEGSR